MRLLKIVAAIAVAFVLMNLHFAEPPRELHLAVGRKLLRREQQHLVAQVCPVNRIEDFVADVLGQLDAGNLGAQVRAQRANGDP